MSKDEIIIYKSDLGPEIEVRFQGESLWLSLQQIAQLFGRDKGVISRHISNIFKEAELNRNSVVAKNATTAADGKVYQVDYYNLDIIISVGYRVNSKRGTQFRIWATQHLRDYLLKGYVINKDRLKDQNLSKVKELQSAVTLIQAAIANKKLEGLEKEVLSIITEYTNTWTTLYQYDEANFKLEAKTKKSEKLDYKKAVKHIAQFKLRLQKEKQASNLFGKEVGEKLKALLGNLEQTFDGKAVYLSFEEKAAHLLYFCIKDHPFADGNKRIGSLLFLLYLVENRRIYNKRGERIMSDSALTALALLIAESDPKQKTTMVNLVASLIAKK